MLSLAFQNPFQQRAILIYLCHAVCLIQNNDLEGRARFAIWPSAAGGHLCEVLDFFSDDVDATLVGGVEFEDARAIHLAAKQISGGGQDGRGLPGARGSIEEQVGQVSALQGLFEHGDDLILISDVVDCLGPVLFDPGRWGFSRLSDRVAFLKSC